MKNTLKVKHDKREIVMDALFARNAQNTMSPEYAHLQNVRKDYPHYAVVRHTIKRNAKKECYKGLTYEYMEAYILSHSNSETRAANLCEFSEMRLIAACHSQAFRYPVIKRWFLEKYPEVKQFGMDAAQEQEEAIADEKVS